MRVLIQKIELKSSSVVRTTFLMVFLVMSYDVSAQWETIFHPQGNASLPNINAVHFTSVNNGIAVGTDPISYQPPPPPTPINQGQILMTSDTGDTWSQVLLLDSIWFTDVTVLANGTILAVGPHFNYNRNQGLIARSTDWGTTWDTLTLNSEVRMFDFPGSDIGYLIGNDGLVYKSTDAGTTWAPSIADPNHNLYSIWFKDTETGFVCGDSTIFSTIDGGISWSTNFTGDGNSLALGCNLFFSSDSIGYFLTPSDLGYLLYRSQDAGSSWNVRDTIYSGYLHTMYFTSDSVGYLTGQFELLKTEDGGKTWSQQNASPPGQTFWDDLSEIQFLSGGTGFLVGSSQFYRIVNPADTVTRIHVSLPNYDYDVSVRPNPMVDKCTVSLNGTFPDQTFSIQVYNSTGQVVKEAVLTSTDQSYDLYKNDLGIGLFFINLVGNSGNHSVTKLMVVD